MKLSVVIITYNEEYNIDRCLKSVQEIADEIIVLDSFSNDKTKEICKNYNLRFVEREWQGYSKSKNYANSLAVNDFVFSIDADEVVSPELSKEILEIKKQEVNNKAFVVKRITNFCGKWIKHCGWYPDKALRIWNKKDGNWQGEIHEKVCFKDEVKIQILNGDLLHYSFNSIQQHLNTINKFSTISAKQRFEQGKKTNCIRILIKPIFKFLNIYFVKFGFLDGYYGYVVCKNSAFYAYLKEIKIKELQKGNMNSFFYS